MFSYKSKEPGLGPRSFVKYPQLPIKGKRQKAKVLEVETQRAGVDHKAAG